MIRTEELTGLILAGGRGSRMGAVDKGLQPFRGYPMVMHVLMRLAPQVGHVLVSANQNLAAYEALGYPVVIDAVQGYAGPLAGLHAGLSQCETEYLVSAPCDSPFLPLDLAARLVAGYVAQSADVAVAKTDCQAHPVFCLVRTALVDHLGEFLANGGRKIDVWYASLVVAEVEFDDADAFRNINTLDELKRFEAV